MRAESEPILNRDYLANKNHQNIYNLLSANRDIKWMKNIGRLKAKDFIPLYGIYVYCNRIATKLISLRKEKNSKIENIISENTIPRYTLISLSNAGCIFLTIRLIESLLD